MSQACTDPQLGIDPRGTQFAATLTSVVLAAVLLTAPSPVGVVLLVVQALLFGLGLALGVQKGPWALVFRRLVRPRLAPPQNLGSAAFEDAAPPRFAQGVGLAFAVAGLAGYLAGSPVVGAIAVGLALVAALLNAVFGYCLGCEIFLLVRRLAPARSTIAGAAGHSAQTHPQNPASPENPKSKEKVIA